MAGYILFGRIRKWIEKWRSHTKNQKEIRAGAIVPAKKFSPMTYKNPCICSMHAIIGQVLREKQICFKNLELIIIDAELETDDEDIWEILWQLCESLNYLLIVTDRPDHYESFVSEMYEENGLIVQQIAKSDRKRAHGNFMLDFERSGDTDLQSGIRADAIYLPIYKKPWEIAENLDIAVPVGYNTLVVESIYLPQIGERSKNNKIDRLDREFRKG